MDSRLRASPRHGGAGMFLVFNGHLNRRGGVPSGAATFIPRGIRWTISRNIQYIPFSQVMLNTNLNDTGFYLRLSLLPGSDLIC